MLAQPGLRRPSESEGVRQRRRPSAFLVVGLLLAATTIVTVAWSFAVYTDAFAAADQVPRFADAGFVAAVLGWAGFARSFPRAALRPLLSTAAFWAALMVFVAVLDSSLGRRIAGDLLGASAQGDVIVSSGSIVAVDASDVVGILLQGALGLLVRAAVTARAVTRRCSAFAVVVAVAAMALPSDGDEVVVTALFGIAATAWLVWALRRARAAHLATAAVASAP